MAENEPELAYDATLMKEASDFINGELDALTTTLTQLGKSIDEYIAPASNSSATECAFNVPEFSERLNKLYHDSMDTGLEDFKGHSGEWNAVMALISASTADLTDQTLSSYGVDVGALKNQLPSLNTEGETNLLNLNHSLDFNNQRAVNEVMNLRYDKNNQENSRTEWNNMVAGLSEAQKSALEVAVAKKADEQYEDYKRYADQGKDFGYVTNQGTLDLLAERYAQEKHGG